MAVNPNAAPIMAAPDHTAVFNMTLGQVRGELFQMSEQEQQSHISLPVQLYGMDWVLSIERTSPENGGGGFDILVTIHNISVPIHESVRDRHPFKGTIALGNETFDPRGTGAAFNLVGKNYPADAVQVHGDIQFSLRSGATRSSVVTVSCFDESHEFGGWYDGLWRGAGAVMLRNHTFDPVVDGAQIEVAVKFRGTPRPVRFV